MEIDELLVSGAERTDVDDSSDGLTRTSGTELFDADGDGYEEGRITYTAEGLTVARDRDEDGVIDTFTGIGRGGHYESWEIFRAADGSARWHRTGDGDVFG